jgi:hypothetical protein
MYKSLRRILPATYDDLKYEILQSARRGALAQAGVRNFADFDNNKQQEATMESKTSNLGGIQGR